MKKMTVWALSALFAVPAFADTTSDVVSENNENNVNTQSESEFMSDERTEEGFITSYLNSAIASGMQQADQQTEVEYGRKVTSFISAPKFGGYFIGKYAYSSKEGQTSGNNSFSQRLVRFYVDGTILNDFAYRIQIQTNNASFHMKDFFVEWKKYAEFKVKIGQYKRAFGLENPMNPWDVGVGDYSQLTKKLTGHSDFIGAENSSNGGRDQGIQIQGDLFPAKDGHRFVHYQLMVSNGQGINTADANSQKDITGTIHIQPIKGLTFGVYGWTGNFTSNGVTVDRNRYLLFGKYEANDWSVRAEYAHSTGHKVSDYKADEWGNYYWAGTGRADAWYATVGIPCTPWLKTWLKYDAYRDNGQWNSNKSIYSISPNIQLHKNLMFQPQFNYVHENATQSNYTEFWLETYVRF